MAQNRDDFRQRTQVAKHEYSQGRTAVARPSLC